MKQTVMQLVALSASTSRLALSNKMARFQTVDAETVFFENGHLLVMGEAPKLRTHV